MENINEDITSDQYNQIIVQRNFKGKLQEFCQKNRYPIPIYESWSEGEHHKLKWSAHVNIISGQGNIFATTKIPTYTKIDAEKQAAMILFNQLSNNEMIPNKLHTISLKEKIPENINSELSINTESLTNYFLDHVNINKVYFIDLENIPVFKYTFKNNAIYIGFLNSIHHSVNKYNTWHKCQNDNIQQEINESKCNKLLYLIEGGTTDLVDHFMTAMIYPLLNFINNRIISPEIIIISKDHAGWCTRTCMEKIFKWKKILPRIENSIII